MATRQLALIASQPSNQDDQPWKLDEHTKAVGRAGVARARLALATHQLPADHGARPSAA